MEEMKFKITSEFIKTVVRRFVFLFFGASIAAFAIECFLVPNKIIDGGIIGISMMCAYKTKWALGLIILALNFPFILMALKKLGKAFVFYGDRIFGTCNCLYSCDYAPQGIAQSVFGLHFRWGSFGYRYRLNPQKPRLNRRY